MATAVRCRGILALTLGLAIAACAGDDDPGSAPTTPPPASEVTVTPTTTGAVTTVTTPAPVSQAPTTPPGAEPAISAPITDATVSVSVLDPGTEPRVELRYRLQPGTITARLSQSQLLTQTVDGVEVPAAGDTGSVLEMTVATEPETDGYRLTSEITAAMPNPDVDATLVDALTASLQSLVGVRTVSVIDDRGVVRSSELDEASLVGVPDEMAAAMSSVAGQMQGAVPLPEEPVGEGARWRYVQRIVSGGIPITQTFDITVVSIDGGLVTLSSTGSQLVALGPVDIPTLPEGSSAEVTRWAADITAEIVIDLTEPVPTSTLRSVATQTLVIADGGQSVTLDQTIDLEQRFERIS